MCRSEEKLTLDDLEKLMLAFHHEGLCVRNYRVETVDLKRIALGIQDGIVAGVYTPLRRVDSTEISFFVEWSDGTVSSCSLSCVRPENLQQTMRALAASRYQDDDARIFLGPQVPPNVPLHSPDTVSLFTRNLDFLYEVVGLLQRVSQARKVRNLTAGISGCESCLELRSSKGLQLKSKTTNFSYYYNFDGILGDSHERRDPFRIEEIEQHVAGTVRQYQYLRRKPVRARGGNATVIFHPNFLDELVYQYIVSNLNAQRIVHGQSPWSVLDFREGKKIFRDDVNLVMDPTVPLSSGSYHFTQEGVPAKRETYIQKGRLHVPIVSLKYSKQMEMPPSCPPNSRHSLDLGNEARVDFRKSLSGIPRCFLIFSALGMHTQDRISGNYSLLSPRALYIRRGEIVGPVALSFHGNVFTNLNEEEMEFIDFKGYRSPGMKAKASVSVRGR